MYFPFPIRLIEKVETLPKIRVYIEVCYGKIPMQTKFGVAIEKCRGKLILS